jgi:hypothetical protein
MSKKTKDKKEIEILASRDALCKALRALSATLKELGKKLKGIGKKLSE